jgi:hypothetical protein
MFRFGISYLSRLRVTIVWTSVTIAKDHVQCVFGRYILGVWVVGVTLAYPSLARKPPPGRRKAGSKEPPKREARDPCEGILPSGSVVELRSAE